MQFQVGDKVRCTLKKGDHNSVSVHPNFFGQTGTVIDNGKVRTGCVYVAFDQGKDCDTNVNYVPFRDLQYIFQEGDIVEDIDFYHKGACGVVSHSDVDGDVWVFLDDYSLAKGYCYGEKNLKLIDRAPKSDAEQCCSREDEPWHVITETAKFQVGDRVVVISKKPGYNTGETGTVTRLTDWGGDPAVTVMHDSDGIPGLYVDGEIALITGWSFKAGEYLKALTPEGAFDVKTHAEMAYDFGDDEFVFPVDQKGEDYFGEECDCELDTFVNVEVDGSIDLFVSGNPTVTLKAGNYRVTIQEAA